MDSPIEDSIVCFRHYKSRIFSFSCRHGDIVRSCNSETCLDEALQEAEKVASLVLVIQPSKGTRIVPVAKAISITERITTKHRDESVNNEANDKQHLA